MNCFNVSKFGRSNKCHLHLSGCIPNLRSSTFCISVTILSLIDCRIDPIFKEELFSVVNWGAQVSEFISFEVHLKGPTAPIDPLRSMDISLSLKLTFYHKILTGNFISSWSFFPPFFPTQCFWLIMIQLKILIIITTGVIIAGLCVRGSSVIQYLSCRPSFAPCFSSSLMLPTAFHQLTYTHFKQGTSSTAAMSSANTARSRQ